MRSSLINIGLSKTELASSPARNYKIFWSYEFRNAKMFKRPIKWIAKHSCVTITRKAKGELKIAQNEEANRREDIKKKAAATRRLKAKTADDEFVS